MARFGSKPLRLAIVAVALMLVLHATGTNPLIPDPQSLQAAPYCDAIPSFATANFSQPTRIDNERFPLVPGSQFTMEGTTGAAKVAHRVVFTVTDLTKVINGIRTVVMFDRDVSEGDLVESEIAFFAQDDDGNVWNLGEYPEEYERGVFVGAPDAWIAGQQQAEPGTLVPGSPRVGTPPFLQGWSPNIQFLDCGRVSGIASRVCAPVGCYEDVLVIEESSPLEPGSGIQRKYYARGAGNILIDFAGGTEAETLELTSSVRLSEEALAAVREDALRLDQRAYSNAGHIYGSTSPAETAGGQPVTPPPASSGPSLAAPSTSEEAPPATPPALIVSTFEVSLTGDQVVPAVSGPGSAFGRFTFDAGAATLTYALTVSGISQGQVVAAHIRRGAAGSSGPVVQTLPGTRFSQVAGTLTLSQPDIAELKDGSLYVEVQSVDHSGGFARGQLRPQSPGAANSGPGASSGETTPAPAPAPASSAPTIRPPNTGDAGLVP